MSRELEEQLAAVPERWREETRTRIYAVMDYLAAGAEGSLLVPVLCRRTGLTTSAFYTLVRRWKASGGKAAALVPWARRPDSKPRIAPEATAHIDRVAAPLIAENPRRPTEPIAQQLLTNWPSALPRAGISYVRHRVNQLRTEHEKKTRRIRGAADDGAEPGDALPRPRWPLDVIVIDHVAVEAVVWLGDEDPTLPIATLAMDLATSQAIGIAMTIVEPTPAGVAMAIAKMAATAARRHAPGPPTIVLSTTFARGWPELTTAMSDIGAHVVARRTKRLSFGSDAVKILSGQLGGYGLAARLGHRLTIDRAGPRAVATMPSRDYDELNDQLQAVVRANQDRVLIEDSWPPAATSEPELWSALSMLERHPLMHGV